MSGGTLAASVFNQGYVAINSPKQNRVLFPSVGVNAAGNAVIAFSIAGEDFFPSAGMSAIRKYPLNLITSCCARPRAENRSPLVAKRLH